jgi:hypothetical protein
MTLRRGKHSLKYRHRRLIEASILDASDSRRRGGEH